MKSSHVALSAYSSAPGRLMIFVHLSHNAHLVAGVAEGLPLLDASIDVVWISTALHRFAHPATACSPSGSAPRGSGPTSTVAHRLGGAGATPPGRRG